MAIAHLEHIHASVANLGMTGLMFPSLNRTNVVMIKKIYIHKRFGDLLNFHVTWYNVL
jgi:hypothetical protein